MPHGLPLSQPRSRGQVTEFLPVETRLRVEIQPQPDDTTCGPTCLDAIYRYYGDPLPLEQVIAEVPNFEEGGTLAVWLGSHALRRGYTAKLFTYNLQMFDPTWFAHDAPDLAERLATQADAKDSAKLQLATQGYLEFLELGGEVRFQDLTKALIRKYLDRSIPILTGLSSTYLYSSSREIGEQNVLDDIRGEPAGHFVVLCGYERDSRQVLVADPYSSNPHSDLHLYQINIDRVICAILLGIVTYDANLLIIEPTRHGSHAHVDRRQ